MVEANFVELCEGGKPIKYGEEYDMDASNIVIGEYRGKIQLSLTRWEASGLKINANLHGWGLADYNDEPFPDDETALREYERVDAAIKNRRFKILFQPGGNYKLRLVLTDEEGPKSGV